jgi:excisionase family DNA binding protein
MRNPDADGNAELLSVAQVAQLLQIAHRTVLHRIALGQIAATKVGDGKTSAYVIQRSEVERVQAAA